MKRSFHCIDAHTCGNPVRVVCGQLPFLEGKNMMEKRLHFIEEFDWIRKSLMFEPRGHDMMSGSMIYPPHDPANDASILFIETSGCLPMCGHGTIGTITVAIEHNLIIPKRKGLLRLEVPAGLLICRYEEKNGKVTSVQIENVPSFLFSENLTVDCPDLGELQFDVAYGGNFYAIIDIQKNFSGIQDYSSLELVRWSRILRERINQQYNFQHPSDKNIKSLHHLLWSGNCLNPASTARNAVFYGEKAIDRSPCGTGTSARMAQWYAKGKLQEGDLFIHESIIGSQFIGRIERETAVGRYPAIVPSIEGWAVITGINTIFVDDSDPYWQGFSVV
jgi:4-hydroxyproline epimerase